MGHRVAALIAVMAATIACPSKGTGPRSPMCSLAGERSCAPCDAAPAIAATAAEGLSRRAQEAMLRGEHDRGLLSGDKAARAMFYASDVGAAFAGDRELRAATLAQVNAMLSPANRRLELLELHTVGYSGDNRVHIRVDYYIQDYGSDPATRDHAESHRFYCAALANGQWQITEIVSY